MPRILRVICTGAATCTVLLALWVVGVLVVDQTALPRIWGDELIRAARQYDVKIEYADVRLRPFSGLVFDDVNVQDHDRGVDVEIKRVRAGLSPVALWRMGTPLVLVLDRPDIEISELGTAGLPPVSGGSAVPSGEDRTEAPASNFAWRVGIVVADAKLGGLPGGSVALDATAVWRAGDLRVLRMDARRGETHLAWRGDIGLRSPGGGELRLVGLDVAGDLPLPERWRMGGRFGLQGAVSGTLADPHFDGRAQLDDGLIWGVPVAEASGKIGITPNALILKQVAAQAHDGAAVYEGSGRVDLTPDGGLDLTVGLRGAPAADLAAGARLASVEVGGTASGQLIFEGPYGKIQIQGNLATDSAQLGSIALASLSGRFGWQPDADGGQLRLTGVRVAQADGSGGLFSFLGQVQTTEPTPTVSGLLSAESLKLGRLQVASLQGPVHVSADRIAVDAALDMGKAPDVLGLQAGSASLIGGSLGGRLHITGTPAQPHADLRLFWRDSGGLGTGLSFGLSFDEHGVRIAPS